MLIDMHEYKESLADLWHVVFGDDYSYINRIFDDEYKNDILCFSHIENGKAVSAFYLLKNTLRCDNYDYNGFYLYSAATLPEYRKMGLMSKLIHEALEYCKSEDVDFVSLVPANDGLYSYYNKFGFREAMYRWKNIFQSAYDQKFCLEHIPDVNSVMDFRRNYKGNMINFRDSAYSYAIESSKSGNTHFYRLSDTAFCLSDDNGGFVYELICDEDKIEDEINKLLMHTKETFCTVMSPYDMSKFSVFSVAEKYGMIYPINKRLVREWKFTDIYMNFALD